MSLSRPLAVRQFHKRQSSSDNRVRPQLE
jgi:hypothetical protein